MAHNLCNINFYTAKSGTATGDGVDTYSASEMILEVSGTSTFTMAVQGKVANDWTTLCGVNMTSFDSGSSITTGGVYSFAVGGFGEVRCNITTNDGNVTTYGRLVE